MPPRLHRPRPRWWHTQPGLQMDPGSLGDHRPRPRPLPRVRRELRANGVIAILTPEPGGVAQSAEAADLKSVQCGFESHRPYYKKTCKTGEIIGAPTWCRSPVDSNLTLTRQLKIRSIAPAASPPM